ncbi:hypothetical protein GOP47_0012837, partial [Adiantum capillus-veneris]
CAAGVTSVTVASLAARTSSAAVASRAAGRVAATSVSEGVEVGPTAVVASSAAWLTNGMAARVEAPAHAASFSAARFSAAAASAAGSTSTEGSAAAAM